MSSEWTVDTLKEHFDALRAADQRALQIKESADEKALELAREIQTYKDEKANELRSQIEREQGERATKAELQALGEKLETARDAGWLSARTLLLTVVGLVLTYVAIGAPHP